MEFLSRFFDFCESNNSFYRPVNPEVAGKWCQYVANNKEFKFTAKLTEVFTHAPGRGNEESTVVAAKFSLLKYALGSILIFVGTKMAWLDEVFHGGFPTAWSLAIIGFILDTFLLLSLVAGGRKLYRTKTVG